MKKLGFILLASFAMTQAEAVLPPLYQTSLEIKKIMADEQLGQKLDAGEVILKVKKNEQGYEVVTNKHRLQVYVEYEPAQGPGPAQIKLRFGNPVPLSQ